MVKIAVNLDGVGSAFTVIDAGKYKARVTEISEGESQSGNPMLTWNWEITEGDNQGVELRSYTSLQEHALFGLKEHLEAFGIAGEVDMDTDKLVGKMAHLVVSKKTIRSNKTGEEIEVNRVESVRAIAKGAAPSAGPVKQAALPGGKPTAKPTGKPTARKTGSLPL